eukprot:scaffold115_cov123-Cylindrotheca_fusiformis.AAC.3
MSSSLLDDDDYDYDRHDESERTFAVSSFHESENSSSSSSRFEPAAATTTSTTLGNNDTKTNNSNATSSTPRIIVVTRMVVYLILILGTAIQSVLQYVSATHNEFKILKVVFQDQGSILLSLWQARIEAEQEDQVGDARYFFLQESYSFFPIVIVVDDDRCTNETMTFELYGSQLDYLGLGDLHHEPASLANGDDDLVLSESLAYNNNSNEQEKDSCSTVLVTIYPTREMQDHFVTRNHPTYSMTVSLVYGVLALFFFAVYDCIIRQRHKTLLKEHRRAQEILSSLFPPNVQDRLFRNDAMESAAVNQYLDLDLLQTPPPQPKPTVQLQIPNSGTSTTTGRMETTTSADHPAAAAGVPTTSASSPSNMEVVVIPKTPSPNNKKGRKLTTSQRLQSFLSPPLLVSHQSSSSDQALASGRKNKRYTPITPATTATTKPIADLFPQATVMFADISGFTAWSSEREPAQVFQLLETVYHNFDKIANKRNVFKVETIGDCYVAVTGLPDPMDDDAVVMAKFAHECKCRMKEVTHKLEKVLGPGTAELKMRFGLHSGPVTAGVLRGDKSRFQLFGDTVNFASRMESTGQTNRIQVSQATADHILEAGLGHWLTPRDDLVHAKGKGEVQTYWVSIRSLMGNTDRNSNNNNNKENAHNDRQRRMRKNTSDSSILVQLKSKRKVPMSPRYTTTTCKQIVTPGTAQDDTSNTMTTTNSSSNNSAIKKNQRRNLLNESFHSYNRWSMTGAVVGVGSGGNPRAAEYSIRDYDDDDSDWDDDEDDDVDVRSVHVVDYDHDLEDVHGLGRQQRLIEWNTEILGKLLKKIVFYRERKVIDGKNTLDDAALDFYHGKNFLEEVTEIIPLFSTLTDHEDDDDDDDIDSNEEYWEEMEEEDQELPDKVEAQLKEYVTMIACMYRENYFHNFEHASHVLMSAQKLLHRVIVADEEELSRTTSEYTRGITSDPLTQFAILFTALIHDVDHTGVPNSQLVKEKAHIATLYNNKSIAEQNSLDLAWELLMDPSYKELQLCIFSNKAELQRFRQLIVNIILATDIFDPDMTAMRNSRFVKAFQQESSGVSLSVEEDMNLKATIVIEYVMQASDVSHTMQHWHIYQKWNERLFAEMYSAWHGDRLGFDPSISWYEGELSFFDNYILPLAKKLKDCQVFGATSDEFLKFALENRKEWEKKGKELVDAYKLNYSKG